MFNRAISEGYGVNYSLASIWHVLISNISFHCRIIDPITIIASRNTHWFEYPHQSLPAYPRLADRDFGRHIQTFFSTPRYLVTRPLPSRHCIISASPTEQCCHSPCYILIERLQVMERGDVFTPYVLVGARDASLVAFTSRGHQRHLYPAHIGCSSPNPRLQLLSV